ncbi:MAG: tRNA (adenosine(37)-N6)-threonylcarbamoyltransferase complex dimerization subunit type 1 TsaB [Candidatus Acidiferrum sp.]
MILLALDTCDSRGSLAVLKDDELLKAVAHEGTSDYSSWVLPSAHQALTASGLGITDVDVFAVATGPGSFTGVRIGLTTVKAWSEAYGKPIANISRLEAMASESHASNGCIAAFVDAHREQLFGGLYQTQGERLSLVEQEMVIGPEDFVNWVEEHAAGEPVSWVSLDPERIGALKIWAERANKGETIQASTSLLAPAIARLGRRRALEGRLTDALALDAEYVRRSDAEVSWKGPASRGR